MIVKIKSESGLVPNYETIHSAGMDLSAHISESITLAPLGRVLVPTGLFIELEPGYEAQVRARSGLAVKHGIGLVNGVGTIDSDYRGEIKIPLINWGETEFVIEDGDRIAQMIISKYETVEWEISKEINETKRGSGGFGHTGKGGK